MKLAWRKVTRWQNVGNERRAHLRDHNVTNPRTCRACPAAAVILRTRSMLVRTQAASLQTRVDALCRIGPERFVRLQERVDLAARQFDALIA